MQKHKFEKLVSIILGASSLSFGLFNVHHQSGITEGGGLGLELLLDHWFHISPAYTSAVCDTAMYLTGAIVFGKGFIGTSFISTACFSLTYKLWEWMGPVLPDLSSMPWLASIVGALFVGIGCGLVVRQGGACGGDDALAMVLAKKTKQPIGRCYLFSDVVILVLSFSYIPFAKVCWSLVSVTLSSWILGRVADSAKHNTSDQMENAAE